MKRKRRTIPIKALPNIGKQRMEKSSIKPRKIFQSTCTTLLNIQNILCDNLNLQWLRNPDTPDDQHKHIDVTVQWVENKRKILIKKTDREVIAVVSYKSSDPPAPLLLKIDCAIIQPGWKCKYTVCKHRAPMHRNFKLRILSNALTIGRNK